MNRLNIKTKQTIMKSRILISLFLMCISLQGIMANTELMDVTIKGKIVDDNNQPVEFATAALVNPKTNEIVRGEVSNEKGEFTITKVGKGNYSLQVSMVGYTKNELSDLKVDGKMKVIEKSFILHESSEMLKDVVITAHKQFIEQTVDKTVINPEVSPTTASENVYDILRKLPGVNIDNNDNISLKGLQGITILIDDKPTYVTGSQLAAMLKSMQGKNVDKIEIIENPSAKYDAEGNSGIINIKTKHVKSPGFNGSVNGGASLGRKFGWNGGIDLNMNYGKLNLYGNYSNYNWAGANQMTATRRFTSTELEGAYQLINSQGEYAGTSNNYKIGADYYLTKNQVISAMLRGNAGNNHDSDASTTSFTDKYMQVDSMLQSTSKSKNNWSNTTYNLNYKWDIDSLGQSLSVDADYATFGFASPEDFQSGEYLSPAGADLGHGYSLSKDQGSTIKIMTSKMDYSLPVNKNLSFDAGLKVSFVNTDSHMDMNGYMNQSDHFVYDENIQAAYLNAKAQLNKTTLQLGLRLENTYSKGNSVNTNEVNDTTYLKLFPSFFVQQKLNDNNSLNFKYSYRIGRPDYDNLNPFRWMVDPYTYNVGNPNLKPQFTHSMGLTHNFKNALITSLGMNYTTGLFTQVIEQDDASKTVYQTMRNLNNSMDINLSETFQFQPFKWWRLNGTVIGMYKRIELYSANENLDKTSFMGNMSNNFSLPYKIEMEVKARYSSEQLISNLYVRPQYSIDLGVQRKIFNDNGMIKVGLSDIFKTYHGGGYAKNGNVDIDVMNYWDSRKLSVSFSYRFGNDNFKTRANRSTSSNDEQNRSSK